MEFFGKSDLEEQRKVAIKELGDKNITISNNSDTGSTSSSKPPSHGVLPRSIPFNSPIYFKPFSQLALLEKVQSVLANMLAILMWGTLVLLMVAGITFILGLTLYPVAAYVWRGFQTVSEPLTALYHHRA